MSGNATQAVRSSHSLEYRLRLAADLDSGSSGHWRGLSREAAAELALLRSQKEKLVEALVSAENEALRYAAMYEAGSDGRNTFVMLADRISDYHEAALREAGQ